MQQKWEYDTEVKMWPGDMIGTFKEEDYLNDQGKLGWELCGPPVRNPIKTIKWSGMEDEEIEYVYYWKKRVQVLIEE